MSSVWIYIKNKTDKEKYKATNHMSVTILKNFKIVVTKISNIIRMLNLLVNKVVVIPTKLSIYNNKVFLFEIMTKKKKHSIIKRFKTTIKPISKIITKIKPKSKIVKKSINDNRFNTKKPIKPITKSNIVEYKLLHQKLIESNKQNERMKNELNKKNQFIMKLLKKLTDTKKFYEYGLKPNLSLINIKKRNNINHYQSDEVYKLYLQHKQCDVNKISINMDDMYKKYEYPLYCYLNRNNTYDNNPTMVYVHDWTDKLGKEYRIQQKDALQIYIIENYNRIPALNGQKGLRATINIPCGTILGQYFGNELLREEFEMIFYGTYEECLRNKYAFDMKRHEIIIDAYDFKETCLLTMVNDCRKNIFNKIEQSDKKYKNCEFIESIVDGWPMIFGIACQDINKGDQIMAYYHETYKECIEYENHWQKLKEYNDKKYNQLFN